MGPGAFVLAVQMPVILGDIVRLQNTIHGFEGIAFGEAFPDKGGVDCAVNDDMGDMDALRPQLPREALGEGAKAVLGSGKGGIACAAAQ